MLNHKLVLRCFEKQFGHKKCSLYTSPGRINLIGEHTDYNGGFVLPAAIDKAMSVAICKNGTNTINVYSMDFKQKLAIAIDGPKPEEQWACYIYGVVAEMKKRGAAPGGFDCVFGGDVPLGAGMSSSAALESVFGYAINDQFKLGFKREDLAKIGQMTEHNYVGVRCGIMDQFASLFGKDGHVIRLDCRSLKYRRFPFNPRGYIYSFIFHTCPLCVFLSAGNRFLLRTNSTELPSVKANRSFPSSVVHLSTSTTSE